MRFIVYGVGAIGGTIAARLSLSGHEVAGIARGKQLDTIRADGLLLRTPERDERANFPCAGSPAELGLRDDDVVILTMKSQDTAVALEDLRAAGANEQAVFCAQNGVANERAALRFFPNVYGITVMMPADYLEPGIVCCYGEPKHGIFDIGRYPRGSDTVVADVAAALEQANFAAFPVDDVMPSKYGKLLLNLHNVVDAALARDDKADDIRAAARAEAEAVYRAAGIVAHDVANDPRRDALLRIGKIVGTTRAGGSSRQSLMRGTGSIEIDYLNGEIVLLGRLHGVPVPANAWLCGLGARLVAEGMKPGAISVEEIRDDLRAAGVAL